HFTLSLIFLVNTPETTLNHPLSLHDALPISRAAGGRRSGRRTATPRPRRTAQLPFAGRSRRGRRDGCRSSARSSGERQLSSPPRSEEHTSELQSRGHLVCRLLLEKKKKKKQL